MNQRLLQFLNAENISQAQFADRLGVARASVSHILAGRNRPGFDFLERMANCYPSLSLEWMISGKGKMYKTGNEQVAPSLWDDGQEASEQFAKQEILDEKAPIIESKSLDKSTQHAIKQRSISRIVVFYDDNTFQELK